MNWTLLLDKLVIPAAVTLAGWVWHRYTSKKDNRKEARSLLDDIVENLIYEQLDRYPLGVDVETYLKASRGFIEREVWKVAAKRGLPRNAATEALLHAAIERGTKLLAVEITRLRQLRDQHKLTPI
jgi:hypothetical protein